MDAHKEKLEEVIRRHAAAFLERESNREALISVTHAMLTPDTKNVIIYLSVLPNSKEKAVLDFAKRLRTDMRTYIKNNTKSRVIPYVDFEIDLGEKHRQKIDNLLR